MDRELLALCILVSAEAGHSFSAFLPSYFTVQKFADSPGDIEKIRSGYIPALMFNFALGLGASWITKSYLPLLAVLLASAGMVVLYERAIARC